MTVRSEEQWLALVDSFHAAALGEHSWDTALERLADATGSRSSQLVGVDSSTSVVFNVMTNVDPSVPKFIAETTDINPRVNIANTAPLLKPMADYDFITPEAYRRHSFYQEFCYPHDVPFICFTTLERQEGRFIALSVIRSAREGHIGAAQRDVFASLAPHVRAAVRTHVALEGRGVSLLTGAMETLSMPVFVCDPTGKVRRLTQSAETLIITGRGLELKKGHLRALDPATARALDNAIQSVAGAYAKPGPPVLRTVIVHGREPDMPPIVLDVFALPSGQHSFGFSNVAPRVLIVARGAARGSDGRRADVLGAAYGLTPAETEVALRVAEGKTAEAIAKARAVAVGTVRAQIKMILSKVGVSRQAELAARLNYL